MVWVASMLTNLQVRNMRRFGSPGVSFDLGAMTVLVGPNNAGKSTLMDAAFLACSRRREEALGRIVRRRVGLSHAARWIAHAGQQDASKSELVGTFDDGGIVQVSIEAREQVPSRLLSGWKHRAEGELTSLMVSARHSANADVVASGETVFDAGNGYRAFVHDHAELAVPGGWLIDTKLIRDDEQSVAREYSELVEPDISQEGRLVSLLKDAVPSLAGLSTIRLLLNVDKVPYLAFGNGKGPMLPFASMGDGARLLFRIALDAAGADPGSVLLIEEPELHQHPAAVRALGDLLLTLPKRGVQVVLTTHSPAMLEVLLGAGQEVGGLDLCVASVAAHGGSISTIRGAELRTGWREFAKKHLATFDPKYRAL